MRDDFVINAVLPLATVKYHYAHWILRMVRGNKAEAAKVLQIDRSTLYRLLREARSPIGAPGAESAEPEADNE